MLNDLCIYGVRMFIEYLPISLKDEIENSRVFTEKEVVLIVRDITEGVRVLEGHGLLWSWLGLENVRRKGDGWKIHDCRYH